ncbi:hypothetical protein Peur_022276 [Populus x canadensis]
MENFGVSPVTVNHCYLSLSSLSYFNTLNYFDGREILKRREVNEVRNGKQRRKESQWLNLASKVEDEYIDSYGTAAMIPAREVQENAEQCTKKVDDDDDVN